MRDVGTGSSWTARIDWVTYELAKMVSGRSDACRGRYRRRAAGSPRCARQRVADANASPPAWGIVAVNDDASVVNNHACVVNNHASDGMPSSTVPGPGSLPCSALLNSNWGCDDAIASGLRPDNGFIDYALGDLFWNQGAPGSPTSAMPTATRSPNLPRMISLGIGSAGFPQRPQWRRVTRRPSLPRMISLQAGPGTWLAGRHPSPSGRRNSLSGRWHRAQIRCGPLRCIPFSMPRTAARTRTASSNSGSTRDCFRPDNGPTTIDELSCPPSCSDDPVATNRSSSAVAEPATLSLLGLGMLAFAGLRRRKPHSG